VFSETASTYSNHLPWTQNGSLDGFLSGSDINTVGDRMYQLDSLLPSEDNLPLVSPPEQEVSCDAMDMMWDSIFDDVDTPAAPVDLGFPDSTIDHNQRSPNPWEYMHSAQLFADSQPDFKELPQTCAIAPVDLRFPDSIIDYNQRSPKPWEDMHSAQLFADSQPHFQELLQTRAISSTSSPMIGDTDVLCETSPPVTIRDGVDLASATQPYLLNVPHKRRSKTKQDHNVVESRYRGTLNDRISKLRDLVTLIFRDECSPQPQCGQYGAFASKALVLSTATAQMRHYETSNQDSLVSRRKLEKRVRGLERQTLSISS
jgi:hypothetical protein